MQPIRVWCRISKGELEREVKSVIEVAPMEVIAVKALEELESFPDRPNAVCLLSGSLHDPDLTWMERFCLDRPCRSTVLIDHDTEWPASILDWVMIVERDRLHHDLRPAVAEAFLALQSGTWRARARAARHLHLSVRDALSVALDLRHRRDGAVFGDDRVRMRHMVAIAEKLKVNRPHLSTLCSKAGVPLQVIADEWLTVQAVVHHDLGGHRWKAVARRLGYSGTPGLTALMKRTLGKPPRDLETTSRQVVERFDGKLEAFLQTGHAACDRHGHGKKYGG